MTSLYNFIPIAHSIISNIVMYNLSANNSIILIIATNIYIIIIAIIVLHISYSEFQKGAFAMTNTKTTIQVSPKTRDRLYKLKFRRTYDQFLDELCDLYESQQQE